MENNFIKELLIDQAIERFGEIHPVRKGIDFDECFTEEDGRLTLWFNDKNNSTHIQSTTVGGCNGKKC